MSFLLRQGGFVGNALFEGRDTLLVELRKLRSTHVTIQWFCYSGVIQSLFLSIDDAGVIRHSYGDQRLFDAATDLGQ